MMATLWYYYWVSPSPERLQLIDGPPTLWGPVVEKQTKHRCRFFSLTFIAILHSASLYIATYKSMHHTIVKSGIVTEATHDLVHSESSTSKHAIINTIVSTNTADDALYLTWVVCPTFAPSIHVVFQRLRRCSPKRIEIIAFVDANAHPVATGSMGRIQVEY